MSKPIIEVTTKIIYGDSITENITVIRSQQIPNYDDFDKLGFREVFNVYERTVLKTRKESSAQIPK
jgi:hypothetical protein